MSLAVTLAATAASFGADAAAATPAPAAPGIGSTLFALVFVLALIVALAWVLKRLPGFSQGVRTGGSGLRVVSSTQVGAKERVVIVTEGETRWLLGITAQQVTLIDTLPAAAPAPQAGTDGSTPPPNFLQALMRATGKTVAP